MAARKAGITTTIGTLIQARIAAERTFDNILITKSSCVNKLYVLIFYVSLFLESYLNIFRTLPIVNLD